MHTSLDGEWRLYYFEQGTLPVTTPEDLEPSSAPWVAAQVPGNVELDLHRAGVLPEPFEGENIRQLRPLEFYEWWYVRDFEWDGSNAAPVQLLFEGIDTLATVWLNGQRVGETNNMLVAQVFDVSGVVSPGKNRIAVRLTSALLEAARRPFDATTLSWEGREEAVQVRKAAHVWGWDIMPRAVSAGLWKPVRLESVPEHRIEALYYWTRSVANGNADLGVHFTVRTPRFRADSPLHLRFAGVCGEHRFEQCVPLEFVAGTVRIPVSDARLWWPKGYGDPELYTVTAQLCDGEAVLAERVEKIGLRTVEVSRSFGGAAATSPGSHAETPSRMDTPPHEGSEFLFRVNGVPIMVKGTNWVPLDAFHSRDAERLDRAFELVTDLGCNMVRCWGGNVYESDRFFELCDANGVLVWQDFAFACCRYPQDDAFLERVRTEAEQVVPRLRNHASLALWCGDNEIDACYASDGLSPEQNRITREVLPRVAHRLDPYRAYVPSSPYMPPQAAPDALPEQHLWGPRGYYRSAYYTRHNAAFIGEIGYHGCPNVSSIRRFITPERLWPWQDNAEWRTHDVTHSVRQAGRDRIGLMAKQVREVFGVLPETLEDFALASQIVQAEAKKFFIESTRLRKWRTSGILWWNVIDGWPQFSDAVVDYYFGKKLAYYFIRRAQVPVAVCVGEAGAEKYLPVVALNDTRKAEDIRYRIWDADSGDTVAEGACVVPANENWQVARIRTYASDQRLYLIEWEAAGQRCGNHYLAGTPAFALERYRAWLPAIAALDQSFDAASVAR